MPARKSILLFILISIIFGYTHIALAENSPSNTLKENTNNDAPTSFLSNPSIIEELKEELKRELKEEYLNNKIMSQEEYLDRLDKVDKKYQGELDRLWALLRNLGILLAIIASTIAISSVLGLKKYVTINNQLTKTQSLFNIMEKGIYEKEKEISLKYDEIIGKKKGAYTSLDRANFLDYEHKLYFAYAYLPITKNIDAYKKSLFLLGEYWLERGECGRALLRFREIERIHNESNMQANILMKLVRIVTRDNLIRISGVKTEKYYNLYGYACNVCADQETHDTSKKELFEEAFLNYKKAIATNKNYASPYYNIGRLYGVDLLNQIEALKWYAKVFGKEPDLSKETYRNMTCSLIKQGNPTNVLISTLGNIPDNDPYWQDIIDDEVINPKIKTTLELRSFILKKFPQAKNIA